ncbi:uncharacterized protein LOC129909482 [Episyrphus balteatus]|uniref:uncharacterized protein LOC129909482 n=1 Tax=Episyrphus balteatus TaxID=286459 RepID=UPI0024856B1D|nr:uncharacterized protein LOC129909482 [Episyrphus balteatus]
MMDCNPVKTPLDPNQKLTKEMCPQSETEREEMTDVPYQQAVGSILFAAQVSRPDICFAVSTVSRYNQNPGKPHWTVVKHILRYLKGTADMKLVYTSCDNNVSAFCDADWASDTDERRSVTGYTFLLNNGAISWNSKKQPTVAISTTEAEYMALAEAAQEATWLKMLQRELIPNSPDSTTIRCDNQSAINWLLPVLIMAEPNTLMSITIL